MLNNELLLDLTGDNIKPSDVREGILFHGADGEEKTGTMPDRGAVSVTLDGTTTTYTVPEGRHDGTGTVRVRTQTKSVTPTASSQTVKPDSGYLLSSVTVRAASSGKAGYSGTLTSGGTYNLSINVGVALSSSDHFMLCSSGNSPMAEILNFAYKSGGESYVYSCSHIGDDENGYSGYVDVLPNRISYSGSTVTISDAFWCRGSYVWSIIKA